MDGRVVAVKRLSKKSGQGLEDYFVFEDMVLELLEDVLEEQYTPSEVIRCVQVGLLCVQQRPQDRPDRYDSFNVSHMQGNIKLNSIAYAVCWVRFGLEANIVDLPVFLQQMTLSCHCFPIVTMLCVWFLLFMCMWGTCTSLDTLKLNQTIRDCENETLVSAGGTIELGFLSLGKSSRRYLAIWYRNVSPSTVVWVANRNTPLDNKSGVLKLNDKGVLVLISGAHSTIWSSNISGKAVNDPIAQLLDSGNFVVKFGQGTSKESSILWQSFDEIGDTILPGMKLGWNLETGVERYISSWKGVDNPAEGEYSLKIDSRGYPQAIIFEGSKIKYRLGPWNGESWAGYPVKIPQSSEIFVFNKTDLYYEFKLLGSSDLISIVKLTPSGIGNRIFWTTDTTSQRSLLLQERDQCENYAFCGANSICNYDGNHPTCECVRGYVPKSPDQWNTSIWHSGCVPRNKSNCKTSYTDGFLPYSHMKLPDTSSSCREGSGCLHWFNTLVDLRSFSQLGQDIYIRVPASELDHGSHGNMKNKIVGITGTLLDGQEVAVKRNSKMSDQGLDEFKNEVVLIAKLQHRNLVKLLGCCIQGEEKLLIYEYMPNKSLDYFIFG
ncbi:unnamed protein product [Sphenostylis stenocarpa]|uniref:Uncharacterized protein n=1 Tax=Sphenostylis stenocarpa TaxID=92480 RepID=A0AA87B8E3_9FABA|nr:unnamed protein product [Sphenostylis stenocarpa]